MEDLTDMLEHPVLVDHHGNGKGQDGEAFQLAPSVLGYDITALYILGFVSSYNLLVKSPHNKRTDLIYFI